MGIVARSLHAFKSFSARVPASTRMPSKLCTIVCSGPTSQHRNRTPMRAAYPSDCGNRRTLHIRYLERNQLSALSCQLKDSGLAVQARAMKGLMFARCCIREWLKAEADAELHKSPLHSPTRRSHVRGPIFEQRDGILPAPLPSSSWKRATSSLVDDFSAVMALAKVGQCV